MKRVLLTNFFFAKYTGSELHILEMARLFEKHGYEVTIAVYQKAYPLMEESGTIRVVDVLKEELEYVHYDIVFAQHFSVLDYLCCRYDITYKKLIVSKLSVISELENLPVCTSEADLILCVSDESAKEVHKLIGDDSKVRVFKNSVGEEFFDAYSVVPHNVKPKKIAIISNHVVDELRELPQVMREDCEIDYIGVEFTPKVVNAELLQKYDLIITIGRTVQQCFASGIPVYVYDCFGGPGYIHDDNFEEAEANNFSGRGNFGKKTALELKEDIELNYEKNLANLEKLNQIAKEKYSLNLNFEEIYQELFSKEQGTVKSLNYYEGIEKRRIALYSKAVPRFALKDDIVSQLYFDFGNGFSEENSIRWNVCENYIVNRTFKFSQKIKAFRIDPCDVPAECTICQIYINGNLKKDYTKKTEVFLHYDPQFLIELTEEEQELDEVTLEIGYKFKTISDQGVVEQLCNQLQLAENQIYKLKNAGIKGITKKCIKKIISFFKR